MKLTKEQMAAVDEIASKDFRLSHSFLSAFATSPRAALAYKMRERTETQAMRGGTFAHSLLLEPEKADELYLASPDANATTEKDKWREWVMLHTKNPCEGGKKSTWIDAVENATGKKVLEAAQIKEKTSIIRAVNQNEAAYQVLEMVGEVEMAFEVELFGHVFRGRIDMKGDGLTADLKTVADATAETIARRLKIWKSAQRHGGFSVPADTMQAAIYTAFAPGDFYNIYADAKGEVLVNHVTHEKIEIALGEIEWLCGEFDHCVFESNFCPEIWLSSQNFWAREANGIFQM